MKKQMMYRDFAKYYDLIYSMKDYKAETDKIRKIISKYKKAKGKKLLEVACGSGNYLQYLKDEFDCTGIDVNEGILAIARKKVKGVPVKRANMIDFNLNKKFDVVLCLFSSIGYVKTYSNLERTLRNFYNHLNPDGIAIIEPWFADAAYKAGSPHALLYNGEDVKIARLDVAKKKGNISIMDMHFLVAERNKGTRHFVDRHELGLFEEENTMRIMKRVGFRPLILRKGALSDRNTYVCIKE